MYDPTATPPEPKAEPPLSSPSVSAVSVARLAPARGRPCSRNRLQHSETTVPDLLQQLDAVERASGPKSVDDPFKFRAALKTEDQLSQLRKRHNGKPIEHYHRHQNTARPLPLLLPTDARRPDPSRLPAHQ